MLSRDRVLVTLNGGIPDRVPVFARFTEPLIEIFREKTGKDDPEEYYGSDLRLSGVPSRAFSLTTKRAVDFKQNGAWVEFVVPRLDLYDVIVIE